MPEPLRTATAWELIGFQGLVRIQGGRAVYEDVVFFDDSRMERVLLARIDVTDDGLKQVNRRVDPDTVLEVIEEDPDWIGHAPTEPQQEEK